MLTLEYHDTLLGREDDLRSLASSYLGDIEYYARLEVNLRRYMEATEFLYVFGYVEGTCVGMLPLYLDGDDEDLSYNSITLLPHCGFLLIHSDYIVDFLLNLDLKHDLICQDGFLNKEIKHLGFCRQHALIKIDSNSNYYDTLSAKQRSKLKKNAECCHIVRTNEPPSLEEWKEKFFDYWADKGTINNYAWVLFDMLKFLHSRYSMVVKTSLYRGDELLMNSYKLECVAIPNIHEACVLSVVALHYYSVGDVHNYKAVKTLEFLEETPYKSYYMGSVEGAGQTYHYKKDLSNVYETECLLAVLKTPNPDILPPYILNNKLVSSND